MKTITFFSEKGGVGKSSFSIMYASWLMQHGVSVGLADFNHRISAYRAAEIRERNKFIKQYPEKNFKPLKPENSWPIVDAWAEDVEQYKRNGLMNSYSYWFREQLKNGPLSGKDVILCDFPGAMEDGSFTDLLLMRNLGLVVIPTERDEMTLSATLKLNDILKQIKRAKYCSFINKAQINFRNYRSAYLNLGKKLTEAGLPMLPDMVTYSERMATIDKVDIIRSTFRFPDFNKPEFSNLSDLGINNLFIDVTRELSKTQDLPGTGTCDLSFVNGLKKTDDKKSFRGSSFPEYEEF